MNFINLIIGVTCFIVISCNETKDAVNVNGDLVERAEELGLGNELKSMAKNQVVFMVMDLAPKERRIIKLGSNSMSVGACLKDPLKMREQYRKTGILPIEIVNSGKNQSISTYYSAATGFVNNDGTKLILTVINHTDKNLSVLIYKVLE